MKFTIHGFSQIGAVELGLSGDDLMLLRWFVDFKECGKMDRKFIEDINNMGYWVSYAKVIEDLPILFSGKSIRADKTKLQRMLDGNLSKVLKKDITKQKEQNGTKVFLAIVAEVYSLLVDDEATTQNTESTTQKCVVPTTQKCADHYTKMCSTTTQKCVVPLHKNVQSDISINNKSIKDNIYNINLSKNLNNNNKNYCENENKDIVDRQIDELKEYTAGSYSKFDLRKFLNASRGDLELIKYVYDNVMNNLTNSTEQQPIRNIVQYIVKSIKNELLNNNTELNGNIQGNNINPKSFNNFKARDYDYDSLEKKLLGWS